MKVCSCCGRSFTKAQWEHLPLLGKQVIKAWKNEPGYTLILKNCECGTTLAVEVF